MRPHVMLLNLLALCVNTECLSADPLHPIALHSDNPHYFVWRGESTILVTSGEHYGALLNLDFDYVRYFDELKAHGLNHTRTFTGVYRENAAAFRITDNTLAPSPNRYICPWARSRRPGCQDGGNKFDLNRWDPAYFQRLCDFMAQAQERGIVVELTLFCPMYNDEMWQICPMNAANNVNGVGKCSRTELYTLKHREVVDAHLAVTRKIVRELRDFDNLYYEICNEPYFGGVTMDWQRKIIDAIVESEREFLSKHLISLNVANGRKQVEDPHPAVSIFNFHYCVPPDTVALNYDLNKVIGENETGFRGHADLLYRTEAWDFLLAGGGLYNNLDYSFTAQHPAGTFRDYKSPGGGSSELRKQLGILKQFLYSFDFVRMEPDNSVIHTVSPDLTTSALVDTGKAYAVYLHVPLPNKPKNLPGLLRDNIEASVALELPDDTFTAEWVDTKTGHVARTETFDHDGGTKQLFSPRFSNDIALGVRRDQRFPQTGGDVYFPTPDSDGGWRQLNDIDQIQQIAGMDKRKLDEAFEFIQGSTKNGGLLVLSNGWLVYENYFGRGHRDATPNLASCGKSFTSIAVGMLMSERKQLFPDGLDQKIFTPRYFPPEAFPLTDPAKANIKLGQLLTFTAGIRGNNPAYVNGKPTTIQPVGPDGWQGLVDEITFGKRDGTHNDATFTASTLWCEPGGGYSYATASIHLASVMLRHVAGMELEQYVERRLARPMGWGKWGYGYKQAMEVQHTPGGGGIALRATDMLRFGYLLLHEGRWDKDQLVPAAYVRHASRRSRFNPHFPYSLQFDVNTDGQFAEVPRDAFWKSGSGGHVLYVVPSRNLVVWKLGGRDSQYSPSNTGLLPSPAAKTQVDQRRDWKQTVGTDAAVRQTLKLVIDAMGE